MRILFLSLFTSLILNACSTLSTPTSTSHKPTSIRHHARARITFYHRFEDKFGAKTAMGIRAKETVTVAGPKSISLGTSISIPKLNGIIGNGHYKVQDRGRLVVGLHFDIYFEVSSRREARQRLRSLNLLEPIMDVYF